MLSQSILSGLEKEFEYIKNDSDLFKTIVNYPFKYRLEVTNLSLGIIVLLLVNKNEERVDRICMTDNDLAQAAKRMSPESFSNIKLPMGDKTNIIVKAIKSKKPISTMNWTYLVTPALPSDIALLNQAAAGIGHSVVFPFTARDGGALMYHFYEDEISQFQFKFMEDYTNKVNTILNVTKNLN